MRLQLVAESLSAAREGLALRNWLWSVNLSRFETTFIATHFVSVCSAPTSTDHHTLQALDRYHANYYASELQLIYLENILSCNWTI
jgi:hypothetical protein